MRRAAFLALLLLAACGGGAEDDVQPRPVVSGVPAPDPHCKSDVTDLNDPWVTTGVWVGYIDGELATRTPSQAMAASLAGKNVQGVWLCPPK